VQARATPAALVQPPASLSWAPTIDGTFAVLGEYDFGTSGTVEVSTSGTDGYVIVDAVQFVEQ
jgi:hypothetical protein